MPKPIIVVNVESGNLISQHERSEMTNHIKDQTNNEYHVLIIHKHSEKSEVRFEVFTEKDFTEIKYKELKEMISNSL